MGKVILIVEDNPVFRRGLERLLRAEGYEPHAYGSAEAAEEAVQTEDYDVALLDIRLPGMSGDELGAILIRKHAEKPVAFVTSEFAHDVRLRRSVPGCQIFPKPIQIQELLGGLRTLIES
jgi:two-component system response regulator TctD